MFGTVNLKCFESDLKLERSADFLVVDDEREPILGLETCIRFELVKRLDINSISSSGSVQLRNLFVERNTDIFIGLGKFPGTFPIYLKENSKPVPHYKKRIPFSLLDKLKEELAKMVHDEIISLVLIQLIGLITCG